MSGAELDPAGARVQARLKKVDLTLVVKDLNGAPLLRLGLHVVNKELREGRWIVLTADSEDGRRVLVNLDADVVEHVGPPARAA
jgi:hypothetical protein